MGMKTKNTDATQQHKLKPSSGTSDKIARKRGRQSVSSQSSILDDREPAPQRRDSAALTKASILEAQTTGRDSSPLKPKRGRPSSYTPDKAGEINKLVSRGFSLVKASKELKIDLSVIYDWLARHSDFAENYARAREQRAELIFEDVLTLEEKMLSGELGHNEFRAAVDARKWFLARMAPKNYGDSSKIELSGANGAPLSPIQILVNFEESDNASR